ncbi:hypothetical protein CANARDRAFT_30724 [[Candida] arabinofermentans NRRL YB-2248]|uniref:Bromo domain-containing protein n=1 Tax=[Candida] arabinofermentans NRRL YB-2248 TaxID=983967 RepID=A0A1E4SSS5_9ASCO|nr:hypothetical protein CANARDRAFT_30724 [[Candida] arabinofermentans NRRL YB-2248]
MPTQEELVNMYSQVTMLQKIVTLQHIHSLYLAAQQSQPPRRDISFNILQLQAMINNNPLINPAFDLLDVNQSLNLIKIRKQKGIAVQNILTPIQIVQVIAETLALDSTDGKNEHVISQIPKSTVFKLSNKIDIALVKDRLIKILNSYKNTTLREITALEAKYKTKKNEIVMIENGNVEDNILYNEFIDSSAFQGEVASGDAIEMNNQGSDQEHPSQDIVLSDLQDQTNQRKGDGTSISEQTLPEDGEKLKFSVAAVDNKNEADNEHSGGNMDEHQKEAPSTLITSESELENKLSSAQEEGHDAKTVVNETPTLYPSDDTPIPASVANSVTQIPSAQDFQMAAKSVESRASARVTFDTAESGNENLATDSLTEGSQALDTVSNGTLIDLSTEKLPEITQEESNIANRAIAEESSDDDQEMVDAPLPPSDDKDMEDGSETGNTGDLISMKTVENNTEIDNEIPKAHPVNKNKDDTAVERDVEVIEKNRNTDSDNKAVTSSEEMLDSLVSEKAVSNDYELSAPTPEPATPPNEPESKVDDRESSNGRKSITEPASEVSELKELQVISNATETDTSKSPQSPKDQGQDNIKKTVGEDSHIELTELATKKHQRSESSVGYGHANKRFQSLSVQLLNQISSNRFASMFLKPVNQSEEPQYYKLIKYPTDIRTLTKEIKAGSISSFDELEFKLQIMFSNAIMYNDAIQTETYGWIIEMMEDAKKLITMFKETLESDS